MSHTSTNDDHGDPSIHFDAADPFSFLLPQSNPDNNSMEDSSSSSQDSPPDWSQFSSLWDGEDPVLSSMAAPAATGNTKFETSALDFGFTMPLDMDMDMGFDPSMSLSVEPSALHFDPRMFTSPTFAPQNAVIQHPSQFLQHAQPTSTETDMLSTTSGTGRRMSITSSSSSSGASFSPVMGHASASSASTSVSGDSPEALTEQSTAPEVLPNFNPSDPASELANRVRLAAGVTLAVPVHGQAQQLQSAFTFGAAQKLPIPRLPRAPTTSTTRKSPSPASPASTTSSAPSTSTAPLPGPTTSVLGRPKTSHTTIERRYRTNLNARIQSLKDAVPALRVLDRGKNKTKKEAKEDGADAPTEADGDVVDERGFVDGVKVARKISKANVLGKAAEYIRVLKRREMRLMREQAGLRTLISGLVGGPALLREWEREWVARFGGPERDEVDGVAVDSDDDDEGESDDEDDEGRARKKLKASAAAKPKPKPKKIVKEEPMNPGVPGVVPEKRKRGRPRKVQPPMEGVQVMATEPATAVPPPVQPTQYLLAAFAFFSFFNSPLTSSPAPSHAHHAHTGTVLTPVSDAASAAVGWGWRDTVQVFHLLVSALVLLSIGMPFLPASFSSFKTVSLPAFFRFGHFHSKTASAASAPATESSPRITQGTGNSSVRIALIDALSPLHRGAVDEAERLRDALGVYPGFVGMFVNLLSRGRARKAGGFDRMQLEQRAWVRLGELAASNSKTPFGSRVQAFWGMHQRTSTFAASPSDLVTLALLVRPLWHSRAEALWARAARARVVRPFERSVVGGMTVDDAAKRLDGLEASALSPLTALAVMRVRAGVRDAASTMFVRAVLADGGEAGDSVYDAHKETREEDERRAVIDAGRSMGGRCAALVGLLERVANGAFVRHEDVLPMDTDDEADETEYAARVLLGALVVYRRLFPSTLSGGAVPVFLSPPPSPSRKNTGLRTVLRVALDADVFDRGDLEDAKDRVVDMLVDADRVGRRAVRS